ncbi:MAG TPA: helix-turn-helix domain-containing protein [Rhodocyclaceae bacterium]|nr:helix-turn-helix domain-containing protein [Rhodocyclaceae bacterium]
MAFVITSQQQLGPTLKGLRKQKGLTQVQLARQSGLGQKTISLLETEPWRCSVDSLSRYLSAVDVAMSLDFIAALRSSSSEAW